MSFQPNYNELLNIKNKTYYIAEHPYAPGMPYGQEGRQAVVYKLLGPEQQEVALKVFKPRFRVPGMVTLAIQLAQFADIPGLAVCRRTVLSARQHSDILNQFPDLTYAVMMPWLAGPTWMEVMLGKTELSQRESLKYARFLTEVLTSMEEQNIAHCDLSGPNLIMTGMLDPNAPVPVAMVDVEQMYSPSFQRPVALPGGSPGYAHYTATEGIWSPEADRFAGAVLIAEMLGWCDPRVRKSSWGESFFAPQEMQQDGERYHLLIQVLKEKWGEDIAGLFKRAWESELLLHAPTFGEWLVALAKIDSVPADDVQEVTDFVSVEEGASGAEPVIVERYFAICPYCKAKNEIMPDEDITLLRCKSCSESMNPSPAPRQEAAAYADRGAYSGAKNTTGLSHPTKWGIFGIIMAIIMMLGWVNSSQAGEAKVKDLTSRLKTKDQKIQQVNRKIQDIILKMDESQLMKINSIKLRNENKNGKALSGYTHRFKQKDIRYISYYIEVENIASGLRSIAGEMYSRYISPDGTVIRNPFTSPSGFTMSESFDLSNDNVCELTSGWGNSSGGIYEVGTHKIEFWYKGRLLGRTTFTVY